MAGSPIKIIKRLWPSIATLVTIHPVNSNISHVSVATQIGMKYSNSNSQPHYQRSL
uniref:Uncharacterized protein n=1 Tax=Arundo donax TaxID=35708 RepID=A0A0A9HNB8_ARUDO